MSSPTPGRLQIRRLRQIFRSAGWPCQDALELELLGSGLIERIASGEPDLRPDTLRLTDAGLQELVRAQHQGRQALGAHDTLVRQTAQWLASEGRLAWTGLSLLAPVEPGGSWNTCRPDVFSLRVSSLEHALEPTIHEIKVSRADLLSDLRQPAKRGAYLGLAQRVGYVLADRPGSGPIADPSEIPEACGVMLATPDSLRIARPAPAREARPVALSTWLALARGHAVEATLDAPQGSL